MLEAFAFYNCLSDMRKVSPMKVVNLSVVCDIDGGQKKTKKKALEYSY